MNLSKLARPVLGQAKATRPSANWTGRAMCLPPTSSRKGIDATIVGKGGAFNHSELITVAALHCAACPSTS
jgi:hypothetical protein